MLGPNITLYLNTNTLFYVRHVPVAIRVRLFADY